MSARHNQGEPQGSLFTMRPARCERPAFTVGDSIALQIRTPINDGRGRSTVEMVPFTVTESCEVLTTLHRDSAPTDNRLAVDYPTARLWEAIWGGSARWTDQAQQVAA